MNFKKVMFLSVAFCSLTATARKGNGSEDGDRTIVCTNVLNSEVLVQFSSAQQEAQYEGADFSLSVTSRGDDISTMTVKSKIGGDELTAVREDELLLATLKTDEEPNQPISVQSGTRKGFAFVELGSSVTGDSANVESLERRSESRMQLTLTVDESSKTPIQILCEKQ